MPQKVAFVSLGCPKNQVNCERMAADLQREGFEIVNAYDNNPDAVIVNTCGFIDDAKKEAVDAILEMLDRKEAHEIKALLVTGCLAQRYQSEMLSEIPEIDAVLGLGANSNIAEHVRRVLNNGETVQDYPDICALSLNGARIRETPPHYAYLQIADGCDNRCAYCKIPSIRGPFRSRAMADVLAEANALAEDGVKELILIAQDTTRYGSDFADGTTLPVLLRELVKIHGICWIRLLYCYPDAVTDDLIETIASEDKILPYIDLPLQHADDRILAAMHRRGSRLEIETLLTKLRARIPDISIRTTFITGLPGEDEEAFENLCAFVRDQNFARMGVFVYSPQDGTEAADMVNQVDADTAERRKEILTEQFARQQEEKNDSLVGQNIAIITEDYDGYSDCYIGRTTQDAPDIDCVAYFTSKVLCNDGDIIRAEVLGQRDGDLLCKWVGESPFGISAKNPK